MFIDEWFDQAFYTQLATGFHVNHTFGQIFGTHAYYPHENLELWRPVPNPGEPTRTLAREFQLQAAGADAFNRAYPLHAPKLETYEEFLVIRAKVRPVILLQPQSRLPENDPGYRGRVNRNLCLVGQVFGLADTKTGRTEFSANFVDRVRRMEFPELLFMPRKPGFLEVDSMLRLDSVQSVFVPHLHPTPLALSDEVRKIVRQQFQYLITGIASEEYAELRELLMAD